jgi:hypothetical protein
MIAVFLVIVVLLLFDLFQFDDIVAAVNLAELLVMVIREMPTVDLEDGDEALVLPANLDVVGVYIVAVLKSILILAVQGRMARIHAAVFIARGVGVGTHPPRLIAFKLIITKQ